MDEAKLKAFCATISPRLQKLYPMPTAYFEILGAQALHLMSPDGETWGISTKPMEAFRATFLGKHRMKFKAPAAQFRLQEREVSDFVQGVLLAECFGGIARPTAIQWITSACDTLERESPDNLRIEREQLATAIPVG